MNFKQTLKFEKHQVIQLLTFECLILFLIVPNKYKKIGD